MGNKWPFLVGMGVAFGVILGVVGVFAIFGTQEDTVSTEVAETTVQEQHIETAVSNFYDTAKNVNTDWSDKSYQSDDTWAIYWYICGSDLETEDGQATTDMSELFAVESLPEQVKVVIEAGGAKEWQNESLDATYLNRILFDANGISLISQVPNADMGDADTLESFLSFCKDNYDADHKVLIIWNHGGPGGYVAFDENYDFDALSVNDIHSAFSHVFDLSKEDPPFEMVGFDACLLANLDMASALSDVSRYLVASAEEEPGNGWYYTDWMQQLADNPGMTGKEVGVNICDSYMRGCEMEDTQDEATLSVINLGKIDAVLAAYDAFGGQALQYAYADPTFFNDFYRNASNAMNYGPNSKSAGYTNLIDLGDLVTNTQNLVQNSSQKVLDALQECVVYKVNGYSRSHSSGLSCYFSFDRSVDDYDTYVDVASTPSFVYFYQYELTNELDTGAYSYLTAEQVNQPLLPVPAFTEEEQTNLPVTINDDGYAVMEVDANTLDSITDIDFTLAYLYEEDDMMVYLGTDNNMYVDWENGQFMDNFFDTWGSIDEHLVYMELAESGENYNLYVVPILLNGEECYLQVYYDYDEGVYQILGARNLMDEQNGMSDKNLIILKPGDEITTRVYAATISGEDEPQLIDADVFTVTSNTTFEDMDLGDETFVMMFEMTDIQNNYVYSEPVYITVENGQIYMQVADMMQ